MPESVVTGFSTPRKSIERVSFYDQEKDSLRKCVILSQTKNIEKALLKLLLGEFVHLFDLFKFPKTQQII